MLSLGSKSKLTAPSVVLNLSITNFSNINAEDIVALISISNDDVQIENSSIEFGQIDSNSNLSQTLILNIGSEVLGNIGMNILLSGSFEENNQVINFNEDYDLSFEVTLNQSGFPYVTLNEIRTSPIVLDLNLDGQNEIIFGDHFGNIHVLNSEGAK